MRDPLPGFPYFLSEAVGGFSYGTGKGDFTSKYRRAPVIRICKNGKPCFHATIHNKAAMNSRIGGVIAWCAFDYASPINSYNGVDKVPGDCWAVFSSSQTRRCVLSDAREVPGSGRSSSRTFTGSLGRNHPPGPGKKRRHLLEVATGWSCISMENIMPRRNRITRTSRI